MKRSGSSTFQELELAYVEADMVEISLATEVKDLFFFAIWIPAVMRKRQLIARGSMERNGRRMALLCIPGLGSRDALCTTAQWLPENLDSTSERQSHQVSYCVSVWLDLVGILGASRTWNPWFSWWCLACLLVCLQSCCARKHGLQLALWIRRIHPCKNLLILRYTLDAARVHTAPEDSLRKSWIMAKDFFLPHPMQSHTTNFHQQQLHS